MFRTSRVSGLVDSPALHVHDFVDVLSLAYNESRNGRHLIKAGHLSPESFGRLRSLPTNRLEAWREIQLNKRRSLPLSMRLQPYSLRSSTLRSVSWFTSTVIRTGEELRTEGTGGRVSRQPSKRFFTWLKLERMHQLRIDFANPTDGSQHRASTREARRSGCCLGGEN